MGATGVNGYAINNRETTKTIEVLVYAPLEQVWEYFTNPAHILKWYKASPDWHTTKVVNDMKVGGIFNYRVATRDSSSELDFTGVYDLVKPLKYFVYTIALQRKVAVFFEDTGKAISITKVFEPENVQAPEIEQQQYQSILHSFKYYIEG
jgi:uncharacterized protein YndB with AHSA1/START domain